jgi:hypothetical protein
MFVFNANEHHLLMLNSPIIVNFLHEHNFLTKWDESEQQQDFLKS